MRNKYKNQEMQQVLQSKRDSENLYYEQANRSVKTNPVFEKVASDASHITDEILSEARDLVKQGKSIDQIKDWLRTKNTSIDWWIIKKIEEDLGL
jgi:hypothetical protein